METTSSISYSIYMSIKNRIIEVDFFPGEKISENTLSNYYNVSRTPIKNALIRLEGEGLVDVVSQKGTYVRKLSISNIKETLTIRCYIEAMVVLNEPLNPDHSIIAKLEKNISLQKKVFSSNLKSSEKVQKFYNLDNEFHRLIFKLYGKESLWDYIISSFPQLQIYRVLSTVRENEYLDGKIDDHTKILECLKNDEYKKEVLKHYVDHIFEDDFKSLEQVKTNFPNYFIE